MHAYQEYSKNITFALFFKRLNVLKSIPVHFDGHTSCTASVSFVNNLAILIHNRPQNIELILTGVSVSACILPHSLSICFCSYTHTDRQRILARANRKTYK